MGNVAQGVGGFVKKNPLAAIGIGAGTLLTGGALLPALATPAAAAAGIGGGTAAGLLGAGAAPGLAGSLLAPAAITPAITANLGAATLASAAGIGGGTAASMFGAPAVAGPLALEAMAMAGNNPASWAGKLPQMAGRLGAGMLQPQEQQQPMPPVQRPPAQEPGPSPVFNAMMQGSAPVGGMALLKRRGLLGA